MSDPVSKAQPPCCAAPVIVGQNLRVSRTLLCHSSEKYPLFMRNSIRYRSQPSRLLKKGFSSEKTCTKPNEIEGRFFRTWLSQQPVSFQWRKDGLALTNGGSISGATAPLPTGGEERIPSQSAKRNVQERVKRATELFKNGACQNP